MIGMPPPRCSGVHGRTDLLRPPGVRWLVALADAEEVPEALAELGHEVGDGLDVVDVVLRRRDADAVRVLEQLLAPVVDELARLVEDHVGVLGAGEDVDVVLGVHRYAGALAPAPACGQFSPALDELINAVADVGDDLLSGGHGQSLLSSRQMSAKRPVVVSEPRESARRAQRGSPASRSRAP
jgi:hypothetical protein